MTSDIILFDTNILVYSHNIESSNYIKAKELRQSIFSNNIKVALAHQNLLEFYAIITDPRRVKKPISHEEALTEIDKYIKSRILIIYSNENTLTKLIRLISYNDIKQSEIFDAYLVATMLTNNVRIIYSDNNEHFEKYKEIKVINPFK